jgi:hypothetical protein
MTSERTSVLSSLPIPSILPNKPGHELFGSD